MPATFTRTPVETERKDPGFGGKPPVARRPTGGGGDGENWENRQPGRGGPRDLLSRYRMVLFFALASDLMFFIALVSAFFARQSAGHFTANNTWVLRLAAGRLPAHPLDQYRAHPAQQSHHGNRPQALLSRNRRHGGVVGPGASDDPPCRPLADCDRSTGRLVSRRTVDCLEATGRSGRLLRLQPQQPFFLSHHRHPRYALI